MSATDEYKALVREWHPIPPHPHPGSIGILLMAGKAAVAELEAERERLRRERERAENAMRRYKLAPNESPDYRVWNDAIDVCISLLSPPALTPRPTEGGDRG